MQAGYFLFTDFLSRRAGISPHGSHDHDYACSLLMAYVVYCRWKPLPVGCSLSDSRAKHFRNDGDDLMENHDGSKLLNL